MYWEYTILAQMLIVINGCTIFYKNLISNCIRA